jgi:hypothetical protein
MSRSGEFAGTAGSSSAQPSNPMLDYVTKTQKRSDAWFDHRVKQQDTLPRYRSVQTISEQYV